MHRRALPRNRKSPGTFANHPHGEAFRQSLLRSEQLPLVLLGLILVLGFNLFFALRNTGLFWLVPGSLPFTVLLGVGLSFTSSSLSRLQVRMAGAIGRVNAAFLLFFLFILSMVILYFLLLVMPMGYFLKTFANGSLATDYQRLVLDLAALQSLLFWGWAVSRRL